MNDPILLQEWRSFHRYRKSSSILPSQERAESIDLPNIDGMIIVYNPLFDIYQISHTFIIRSLIFINIPYVVCEVVSTFLITMDMKK